MRNINMIRNCGDLTDAFEDVLFLWLNLPRCSTGMLQGLAGPAQHPECRFLQSLTLRGKELPTGWEDLSVTAVEKQNDYIQWEKDHRDFKNMSVVAKCQLSWVPLYNFTLQFFTLLVSDSLISSNFLLVVLWNRRTSRSCAWLCNRYGSVFNAQNRKYCCPYGWFCQNKNACK